LPPVRRAVPYSPHKSPPTAQFCQSDGHKGASVARTNSNRQRVPATGILREFRTEPSRSRERIVE